MACYIMDVYVRNNMFTLGILCLCPEYLFVCVHNCIGVIVRNSMLRCVKSLSYESIHCNTYPEH